MALLQDYIHLCRLHRPIGIWLLLFPGFLGLSVSPVSVPAVYWVVFFIGAVVMRSAGCIYNDIIDRPFDGRVKRTKDRPLVRKINPLKLKWSVVFLIFNLIIGLLCLLVFNVQTIIVGFITAVMIVIYPWMKRITYWPQLFLGFTMNMGYVIGCFAARGTISVGSLIIYVGMVSWTLGYDTIYGFQDIEDDALIGVKSATFKTKAFVKKFMLAAYGISILCWIIGGILLKMPAGYYAGLGLIAIHFGWQGCTLNVANTRNCLIRFRSNQWVALVLWLSVLITS